jgi:hypothetical protein
MREHTNNDFDSSEFRSGQVLKSRAWGVGIVTFVYHFAVVIVENRRVYVMHNTREQGVVTEKFKDYIEDREILQVIEDTELMHLGNEELKTRFLECKGDFDWDDYNCEHFIDCMLRHNQSSEQKELALQLLAIAGLAYLVSR